MNTDAKKQVALLTVDDLVSDFLYYGRKDDEELSVDDLGELFTSGVSTVDDVVERFRSGLVKGAMIRAAAAYGGGWLGVVIGDGDGPPCARVRGYRIIGLVDSSSM